MYIPDVHVKDQLSSSQWGNLIRDRTIQTFDSLAEANIHLPTLPEGAIAHFTDIGNMYHKVNGQWRPLNPLIVTGTNHADQQVGPPELSGGVPFMMVTLAVPPGYRSMFFHWQVTIQPYQLDWGCELEVKMDQGGSLAVTRNGGMIDASRAVGIPNYQTLHISGATALNVIGGNQVQCWITNIGGQYAGNGGLYGAWNVVGNDGRFTHMHATLIP